MEVAYRELEATAPAVNPGDDPYNANQNYQDAAPVGIDARWAWTQPNGEGAGVGFVDLEQGWFLNHEDFASKSPALLYGDNRDGIDGYVGNHGTAVLGEVIADDNTIGVVGIAPSVSSVNVTSHWDTASSSSGNVADAIAGALLTLQVGDVLLLEIQKGLLPTETDVADLDAIRLAVALGIVVVEAAGNGSFDLDSYTDGGGKFVLNRGSADFTESGAIVVGAALSPLPHNRAGFSNFGSRVDCYGWGENVVTAGYGDLDGGVVITLKHIQVPLMALARHRLLFQERRSLFRASMRQTQVVHCRPFRCVPCCRIDLRVLLKAGECLATSG